MNDNFLLAIIGILTALFGIPQFWGFIQSITNRNDPVVKAQAETIRIENSVKLASIFKELMSDLREENEKFSKKIEEQDKTIAELYRQVNDGASYKVEVRQLKEENAELTARVVELERELNIERNKRETLQTSFDEIKHNVLILQQQIIELGEVPKVK